MTEFGKRLKGLRESIPGLDAKGLSVLAGLHPSHVGRIESGSLRAVHATTACALARVLGVSVEWLVMGEGRTPDRERVALSVTRARLAHSPEVIA